jgi:hypothetical protein
MPDAETAIVQSNLPAAKKSYFLSLMERGGAVRHRAGEMMKSSAKHLSSVGSLVRDMSESGATVLALSAVDVYNPNGGLDYKSPTSTGMAVPIDGITALVGLGASVLAAGHEYAHDVRNVGMGAFNVVLFRKSHSYWTEKHLAAGGAPAGTMQPGSAAATPASAAAAQNTVPAAGKVSKSSAGGTAPGFGNEGLAARIAEIRGNL